MRNTRRLSILYVAYPLLTVTEESAGGAEQMLLTLERQMSTAGHRTTVAAANGSRVAGRLFATGEAASRPDQFECREREHHTAILGYLGHHPGRFDLIHDESGSFFRLAGQCPVPMLATLHLPRPFYCEEWFQTPSPNLHFNCVSQAQASSFRALANIETVQNGIAEERFSFSPTKHEYLLWMGRICEEKAPHLAIAAAAQAGLPLVIAGQVYPFSYHQDYFDREIRPYLSEESSVRFISAPSHSQKVGLLRHARALLLTSTAEETSSLVAIEAMACGTPVVGFRRGAFPEIVAHGETGFIVDTLENMVGAIARTADISAEACRISVGQRFTARRMALEYETLYRKVVAKAGREIAA